MVGRTMEEAVDIPLELSLPKASFTSEAEFRRERDAILFADWFCVGRAERLAAPGDYLTADVAGESVVIVHGDDDVLRGFINCAGTAARGSSRQNRPSPPRRASGPAVSLDRSGAPITTGPTGLTARSGRPR